MKSSVIDYLETTSKKLPHKVGYEDEKESLSFGELRDASISIAGSLIDLGIFKSPIVIYMEKSINEICAFMGTAYSTNFYIPIDVNMPVERAAKILDRIEPKAVITDNEHEEAFRQLSDGCEYDIEFILLIDECRKWNGDKEKVIDLANSIIDKDILYVLFTSGSTGIPKGVMITHGAVINYIDWVTKYYNIEELDVIGNQAPLFFDLSIQDIYAPIAVGCETVLIDAKKFAFPTRLMSYMKEKSVTMIMWVPTMLCMVANMKGLSAKDKPQLKKVFFCGEVMPIKQLNMWRNTYPESIFVNFYGPTEACDACAAYKINRDFSDDESLPIGKAGKNTEIVLLDEGGLQITEKDKEGEICIRGKQVAVGYYKDQENTNKSFIIDPRDNASKDILYCTGDLAYWNEYGDLIYVSRKDYQIKHLGHRIELGEIESAALTIDGVEQCGCVHDKVNDRIVLFYSGKMETKEVLDRMKQKLQTYMIPGRIEKVSSIHKNSNGKIDRKHLEEMILEEA